MTYNKGLSYKIYITYHYINILQDDPERKLVGSLKIVTIQADLEVTMTHLEVMNSEVSIFLKIENSQRHNSVKYVP